MKTPKISTASPLLIIFALILLVLSLGGFILSFTGKNSSRKAESGNTSPAEEKKKEDSSLNNYFDEEFSESEINKSSDYRKTDPFQGICEKTEGSDKTPSVSSNTVCFY